MKFKTRFMLLIGVVVLVSLVTVSVVGIWFSIRDLRRSAEERLDDISVNLGENIRTWMDDKSKLLITGNQVLADGKSKMKQKISEKVLGNFINDESILCFYIVFDDGHFISSDGWVPEEGVDAREKSYYKGAAALSGEAIYFSDVYVDATTNESIITIAKRLYDADGEFAGVICEDVLLATIQDFIVKSIEVSGDISAYLIDHNDVYVYHGDEKYLGKSMKESGLSDIGTLIELSEHFDYAGKEMHSINRLSGLNWKLGVSQKFSDIYGNVGGMILFQAILTLIIILVSMVAAYFFGNNIVVKPIKRVSQRIVRFANYDFRDDDGNYLANRRDEVGNAIRATNTLQENLKRLFSHVKEITDDLNRNSEMIYESVSVVAEGSNNISRAVEELAVSATRQAQEADKATRDMSHFSDVLEASREANDEVLHLSSEVESNVNIGLGAVRDLANVSVESNAAFMAVRDVIVKTGESSEKIGAATELISAIADQTNLLALNAAIEAARAGEQGKGFAVVAEEIRKLAESSSESTKQIREIVKELKENASSLVQTMQLSENVVQHQVQSVASIEEKYSLIATAIEKSNSAIRVSTGAVKEMEHQRDNIIQVLHSVSGIAEENAASTEEASAAAVGQAEQVSEVNDAIDNLHRLTKDLSKELDVFRFAD